MSSTKLVNITDFAADSLNIGAVRKNLNGMGSNCNLSYDGGRFNMVFQDMFFKWGASPAALEYRKNKEGKDEWSVECSLSSEQIEQVRVMDERIIDLCHQNAGFLAALGLAGKKTSREVVESKYNTILRIPKDKQTGKPKDYPPSIRIAIANDKANGFTCSFFKAGPNGSEAAEVDNIPGSENNIGNFMPKDSKGAALANLSIWISAAGFGVKISAAQLKVEPGQRVDPTVCLLDGLVPGKEVTGGKVAAASATASAAASKSSRVEPADDPSDVEEADDEEEEPTPPPVKKGPGKR